MRWRLLKTKLQRKMSRNIKNKTMNEGLSDPSHKTDVIRWVALQDEKPKNDTEIIMYREDAGVFFGYYGCLEDALPEDVKDNLYEQGLTEDDMFNVTFYYFDMNGSGLLELDTLPQFWAYAPNPPVV